MSSVAEPTSGPVPFRVPKTAELVAHHLRKQIVRGELREGESLPSETALTERFGVSRPTLREAFRVLEAEQLITVRRGAKGGANVHAPSTLVLARYAGFYLEHARATLSDVFDARVAIEAPAAGLAAKRATADDVARLRAAAAAPANHDDATSVAAMRFSDFHSLVVELSGSRSLALVHTMLRGIVDMAKLKRFTTGTPGGKRRAAVAAARAHVRLVDLIEARDSAGAEAHWREHLVKANEFLLQFPGSDRPLDLLD